jgi:hypothetical protein
MSDREPRNSSAERANTSEAASSRSACRTRNASIASPRAASGAARPQGLIPSSRLRSQEATTVLAVGTMAEASPLRKRSQARMVCVLSAR